MIDGRLRVVAVLVVKLMPTGEQKRRQLRWWRGETGTEMTQRERTEAVRRWWR
jgi:hypothetical protein